MSYKLLWKDPSTVILGDFSRHCVFDKLRIYMYAHICLCTHIMIIYNAIYAMIVTVYLTYVFILYIEKFL